MALEREIVVYRQRLPELLAHEGQFVVIHGDEIMGFANDLDGALKIGYRRYGTHNPFLVKRVERVERPVYTNRNVIECPSSMDR